MNKSDLIRIIASNSNIPLQDVDKAVDILLEAIADSLADAERIEIRGFGAFTIREIAPRKGRNPRTGAPVEVPAKRAIHFKPGREMREMADGKRTTAQHKAPSIPGGC